VSAIFERLRPSFDAMKARYPADFTSSLALPCLRAIQSERGWVADEDVAALVAYLAVPRMQVEQVLSFYTQFRRAPIGRWHLQACRNVSCSLRGAEAMLGHLDARLGLAPGG